MSKINYPTKEQLLEDFKENLNLLLTKQIEEFDASFLSPNDAVSYLEENGFKEYKELSTNGWDWDYWITYKDKKENKVLISGSGYYGTMTISFDTDEDGE